MGRPKKEGGATATSFTLTEEEIELVNHYSNILKFNKSGFVGWLVRAYHNNQNPIKEIEMINEQKKRLNNEIHELEEKEKTALQRIKYFDEMKKEREKTKQRAVQVIRRKIIEGAPREDVEAMARSWAIRLDTDISELLFKASRRENDKLISQS